MKLFVYLLVIIGLLSFTVNPMKRKRSAVETEFCNDQGLTLLQGAVLDDNISRIKILWKHGADSNVLTGTGDTLLHLACRYGKTESLSQLLSMCICKVNAENNDGETPLHTATEKGHYECMRLLLEAGTQVNAETKYGATAIHWAADRGYPPQIDLLFKHGANINQVIQSIGYTALHCAACQGRLSAVKQLVALGADKTLMTKKGETASDLAAVGGYQAIVDYLSSTVVNGTDFGLDDSTVEDADSTQSTDSDLSFDEASGILIFNNE